MLQRLRQRFKSSPRNTIWSLPLPEDIIRLLVEEYLDFATIESLSRTCKGFVLFCRQHIFREVCIGTPPNSPNREKPRPTLVDLKKAIEGSPYILDFIQALRIYHLTQRIVQPSHIKRRTWTLNREGKALRYILLRVKHLKVLELQSLGYQLDWTSLPSNLQDAVCAVFRLNPLERVSISSEYPLELLRWCTALRALGCKGINGYREDPPLPVRSAPNTAIPIQHLSLEGPLWPNQLDPPLLRPSSPIDLSALKTLTYSSKELSAQLSRIIGMVASTLKNLKVYVRRNLLFRHLDLSMLPQLKHITLRGDERYASWMPSSLKTLENATACKLESVELIIRLGSFTLGLDGGNLVMATAWEIEKGKWHIVNTVLQQISRKFGTLKVLRVVCCAKTEAWATRSFPLDRSEFGNLVEDYIRRHFDMSHLSNLYTVEVSFVEENVLREWMRFRVDL